MTQPLNPLWVEFPNIPMGSIGWRMGPGEVYCHKWEAWFRALPPEARNAYMNEWPEPDGWRGWYTFTLDRTIPPRNAAHHAKLKEPQSVPSAEELEITDFYRVVWLMRNYLKRRSSSDVDVRPEEYPAREGESQVEFYEAPDHTQWRLAYQSAGGLRLRKVARYRPPGT